MTSGRKRSSREMEGDEDRGFFNAWSKLNDQRLDGRLCDVILVADEGVKQCAHRCVLAASSDYFSRMFEQTGFIDSQKQEIKLQGVPGEALIRILDFMYTGSLELSTENVYSIVSASDYLLLPATCELCVSYLLEVLKSEEAPRHALKVLKTAQLYGITNLRRRACDVICLHFKEVCSSHQFIESRIKDAEAILSVPHCGVSEEDVWWAAVRWLEHDLEVRKPHLDAVMNHVKFPLLPTEMLVDVVKPYPLIQDSEHVKGLIEGAILYKLLPLRQSRIQSPQTKPRGPINTGVFCLIGTESFYVYMPENETWYSLAAPLPVELSQCDVANFSFKLVFANLKLYAIGIVRSGWDAERYTVKSVQTFDCKQHDWQEIALPSHRENTVFIECGSSLYACSRSAVEVYDCSNRSWSILCQHSFSPYEFVYAGNDQLKFFMLSSGTHIVVNTKDGLVSSEFQPLPDSPVSPVKGVFRMFDFMIVTMMSSSGYIRKRLDMRKYRFDNLNWFGASVNNTSGPGNQAYPLCLDVNQFWHMALTNQGLMVMAAHPLVTVKGTENRGEEKVSDGIMPFFSVKRGKWKRLPSIPEQPGKPISLCTLVNGRTGTNATCSY